MLRVCMRIIIVVLRRAMLNRTYGKQTNLYTRSSTLFLLKHIWSYLLGSPVIIVDRTFSEWKTRRQTLTQDIRAAAS